MQPDQAQEVGSGSAEVRVSTIELFFDLVFVFAITQLTSLLAGDPTVAGLARVSLIFGNLWWMYGGYAWLTNAVPPRAPVRRLLMLIGMGGFLVVALAIPTAFDGGGVAFGLGYLLVTLVHTGMFLLSTHESAVRAIRRLGPANAITAVLLLQAGFTDGVLQWVLWTATFGLHWMLTDEELARLDEVSRIELGFPHDFGGGRLVYGDTRSLIDDHRNPKGRPSPWVRPERGGKR